MHVAVSPKGGDADKGQGGAWARTHLFQHVYRWLCAARPPHAVAGDQPAIGYRTAGCLCAFLDHLESATYGR